MLTSPLENIFLKVLERISTVEEIRFIDQDLGQLENYEYKPAVSWPCALIDVEEFSFTEMGNDLQQIGQGIISIRIGLVKYSDSNNLVPEAVRANALKYYEVEQKVHQAMHGWKAEGFSRLLRRVSVTEKRDDDIRVRILKYATSFEENMSKAKTTVPRPPAIIGADLPD
jgi:hypothetical protein